MNQHIFHQALKRTSKRKLEDGKEGLKGSPEVLFSNSWILKRLIYVIEEALSEIFEWGIPPPETVFRTQSPGPNAGSDP
jgi:hypothetical protein